MVVGGGWLWVTGATWVVVVTGGGALVLCGAGALVLEGAGVARPAVAVGAAYAWAGALRRFTPLRSVRCRARAGRVTVAAVEVGVVVTAEGVVVCLGAVPPQLTSATATATGAADARTARLMFARG